MIRKSVLSILWLSIALSFFATTQSDACAALIIPTSISSQGTFNNSANLLIDGNVPTEFSTWTNATNAWWTNQLGTGGVVFTIDYGQDYQIQDILVSVDNNDAYRVDFSIDNIAFSNLLQIDIGDGEINGGMDTMSSDDTNPEFVAGIDFAPVEARYLRIYAVAGDNLNSIGELQAFGITAVPEPSGLGTCLMAIGILGTRRRRT